MKIRQATFEDAAEIAALHVASRIAAYKDIIPGSILENQSIEKEVVNWSNILQKSPENVFVAVSPNNNIAGFVGIGPGRDEGNKGEIYAIYNHPDYLRTGVGRLLMEKAIRQLHERGYSKITVLVVTENLASRRFYEALGFHLVKGSEAKFYWEGVELNEVRYEYSSDSVTDL